MKLQKPKCQQKLRNTWCTKRIKSFIVKYIRCNNVGKQAAALDTICNKFDITLKYTVHQTHLSKTGVVKRHFVTRLGLSISNDI